MSITAPTRSPIPSSPCMLLRIDINLEKSFSLAQSFLLEIEPGDEQHPLYSCLCSPCMRLASASKQAWRLSIYGSSWNSGIRFTANNSHSTCITSHWRSIKGTRCARVVALALKIVTYHDVMRGARAPRITSWYVTIFSAKATTRAHLVPLIDLQWDVMQVEWLLLAVNRIPEFHELPYMDKRQACFEADASRMHGLQRQLYKGCCSSPGSISSKKLCAKEKLFSRLISIRSNMQGELGIGLLVGAVILILYMLYK